MIVTFSFLLRYLPKAFRFTIGINQRSECIHYQNGERHTFGIGAEQTDHHCQQTDANAKKLLLRTLKDVVTNPIILGIAVGMLWSVLHIPQPTILQKSVSYLGNMAKPLALIALGASFRLENAKGKLGLTLGISAAKLFLFCALFLPAAIWLGFRTEKLIAILVMLGSATTCSCFVMAKNMKHDGTITACAVMMTTLLSAFSLTMWLFVMKSLGYI